jgi:deoxyribonuclease V
MISTAELYRVQEEIASKAVISDKINLKELALIAGADQSFVTLSKAEERIISAIVVLEYPSMRFLDYSYAIMSVDFPYIPGLLSFREAPAIIKAFRRLKKKPGLLVIDGGGINHPRFAGLATHVGVILNLATVGVTKNLLCGSGDVPQEEGSACKIHYKNREIGYYFKSKKGCRPIIVAPGHNVSLKTSLEVIKTCTHKHKLPEPIRLAHLCANKIKQDFVARQGL